MDALEAQRAVRARGMLPVSWGTFKSAFHDLDEPIRRAVQAADEENTDLVTPRLGDVAIASEPFSSYPW